MSTDITFDIRDEYKRKAIAEKIISLLESNIPFFHRYYIELQLRPLL